MNALPSPPAVPGALSPAPLTAALLREELVLVVFAPLAKVRLAEWQARALLFAP
jgi:hypothetical protein